MGAQKAATTTHWLRQGQGTYARLPRLRVPTLVGYGAQDVIIPPSNARALVTRIPHAIGLRVSDAGHAFLFQEPTQTAAAFTRFLDRAEPGSATRRTEQRNGATTLMPEVFEESPQPRLVVAVGHDMPSQP